VSRFYFHTVILWKRIFEKAFSANCIICQCGLAQVIHFDKTSYLSIYPKWVGPLTILYHPSAITKRFRIKTDKKTVLKAKVE